ncbi:hypothetical protein EDD76_11218 [Kineothrix alysoides]|uniref:Phenylacetate-CoA ligase n=1 Tax=Kineothrix alysoides TaxID=1469948 RepID=A0A4R1QT16_9FIRM|nr:hypothetical protein [Kineothrix alysoides]TCL56191.1 hypothetical protein EDD76_11218 [Kineothrix alysoides]
MTNNDLIQHINYLKDNNIFYSKYFQDHVDCNTIEEIYSNMPVITKNIIEDNIREYITKDFMPYMDSKSLIDIFHDVKHLSGNYDREIIDNEKRWFLESTTGSTGYPFTVLKTSSEKLWESKYLIEKRKTIDSNANMKNGFLLLEPIDPILKKIRYRSTLEMDMPLIFNHLVATRPRWILCTTLVLRKLYEFIINNNFVDKVRDLRISFIETTSQKLYDYEIKEISECFNSRIINQYGCREVWNLGYDCLYGNMHTNNQYIKLDLVDNNGNLIEKSNALGDVIITSKLHKSFPFFKYYLGDAATLSYEKCKCGNESPIINLCGGREKDKLINTKYFGTEIFRKVLRGIHYKYSYYNLTKIKIIQDQPYHITVYCLVDYNYRKEFRKTFLEISSFQIENFDCFQISFFYTYPYSDENEGLKPEIFTNIL